MRIVLDVSVLGLARLYERARTGIYRVISELVPELLRIPDRDIRVTSLSSTEVTLHTAAFFEELGLAERMVARIGLEESLYRAVRRTAVLDPARILPRLVARIFRGKHRRLVARQADLFHSTYDPLPRVPGLSRRCLSVYDIIPLLHPEYFEEGFASTFSPIIDSVDPERDWILTISRCSRDDICAYLSMDPERVFVAYPAASRALYQPVTEQERIDRVLTRYGIPEPGYFLSLATLEIRKNIDATIRAFARFLREPGCGDRRLVLVGTMGWKVEEILTRVEGDPFLRQRVILPGYVEDRDLAALYSGALAFVYPSLYEGFGLPPLEAMQCGLPVICSRTSSLPEVVGDAALLVDPRDVDGLAQVMLDLAGNSSLVGELREKGLARARSFSWSRCAAETVAAYDRILAAGE